MAKITIAKYTESMQKTLNSTTKPEAWLHVAINSVGEWSIYVWDTREILETGEIKTLRFSFRYEPAMDNLLPLIGKTKVNFQSKLGKRNINVNREVTRDENGKVRSIIAKLPETIEATLIDKYGSFKVGGLIDLHVEKDYRKQNSYMIQATLVSKEDGNYGYLLGSYRTLNHETIKVNLPSQEDLRSFLN
jgi:hypothetical protein